MFRYCSCCKKIKPISDFERRSDNNNYYSWCNECMYDNHRTVDWPPKTLRGGGSLASSEELLEKGDKL